MSDVQRMQRDIIENATSRDCDTAVYVYIQWQTSVRRGFKHIPKSKNKFTVRYCNGLANSWFHWMISIMTTAAIQFLASLLPRGFAFLRHLYFFTLSISGNILECYLCKFLFCKNCPTASCPVKSWSGSSQHHFCSSCDQDPMCKTVVLSSSCEGMSLTLRYVYSARASGGTKVAAIQNAYR